MPSKSVFYNSRDGIRLHVRVHTPDQDTTARPLVCLSGLSRNSRDFDALVGRLREGGLNDRQIIAFDYRGRGLSAADPNWQNYTIATEAADIIDGLTVLDIEHADFIGTSRGGLILHLLAGMRPGLLKRLVLNDIGPVIGGAGLAAIRVSLGKLQSHSDWASADAAIRASHAKDFPNLTDSEIRTIAQARFAENDKGELVPDFDPALLNTLKSIDFSVPLPTLWPQFDGLKACPVLLIRGANSQLLTEDVASEMAKRHPDLTLVTVPDQGHAPLLETRDLPTRIGRFLTD